MVDVLALHTLGSNVSAGINHTLGDVGQVSLNVESEGAELADVHALTSAEVVVEVGHEGAPDDEHLQWESTQNH